MTQITVRNQDADAERRDEVGQLPRDQRERLAQAERWLAESARAMRHRHADWRQAEKTYANEDLFPTALAKITQIRIPLPMSLIEAQMAVISDFLPTFDIMPRGRQWIDAADALQLRKTQIEDDADLRVRQLEAARDTKIYGLALVHARVRRDPFGMEFGAVDPFTFYPAPEALDLDLRKARFIGFQTPMSLVEIRRTWKKGGAGLKVQGEGRLDEFRAFQKVDTSKGSSPTPNDAPFALVKECYWLDERTVEGVSGDAIRGLIWAGDVVLFDGWIDLPRLNYFLLTNTRTAHTLAGMGEVSMLEPIYKAVNRTFSLIGSAIMQYGAPVRKVRKTWLARRTRNIANVPGENIAVSRPDDVTWDNPPPVPAPVFQFMTWARDFAQEIVSIFDPIQGKLPGADTSGRAVIALQEASQGRIRLYIAERLVPFVVEIGEFILWSMQTFDLEVSEIPVEGEQGLDFRDYDPELTRQADVRVKVTAGNRLPAGRAATEARALELFEKGLYGAEDVFEALDDTDRNLKLERFRQREGLQQLRERQEALAAASEQLRPLVDKARALDDPGAFFGSLDDDDLVELVRQFPELLAGPVFQALPATIKAGILQVLTIDAAQLAEAAG